jgi:hypothetical protein
MVLRRGVAWHGKAGQGEATHGSWFQKRRRRMITERHAKTAVDGEDVIQILERALMDQEDAYVNLQEAIKVVPIDSHLYISLDDLTMETAKLLGRLSRRIRYLKRIAAEFGE